MVKFRTGKDLRMFVRPERGADPIYCDLVERLELSWFCDGPGLWGKLIAWGWLSKARWHILQTIIGGRVELLADAIPSSYSSAAIVATLQVYEPVLFDSEIILFDPAGDTGPYQAIMVKAIFEGRLRWNDEEGAQ